MSNRFKEDKPFSMYPDRPNDPGRAIPVLLPSPPQTQPKTLCDFEMQKHLRLEG